MSLGESMNTKQLIHSIVRLTAAFTLIFLLLASTAVEQSGPTTSYLVQATDVRTAVEQVGGTVTHELGIINAVGAQLRRIPKNN